MPKKQYQKPAFNSKTEKVIFEAPVFAAAASAAAAHVVTSALKQMFEEDHHDGTLFSLTPVKKELVN